MNKPLTFFNKLNRYLWGMKRALFLIAAPLMVLASGACSSSRKSEGSGSSSSATSQWQSRPLTVDGRDDDWVKPLPYSLPSESVSYAITNDGQNLYILLSTKNPQEQQKIIQGGMSVWVNTQAEKSNTDAVGIGYPLDAHSDPDKNLMAEAQPQRYENNKPVTLGDKKAYDLYGFSQDSAIQTFTYGENNPQGVQVQMNFNSSDELIYEASIPLTTLYPKHNTASSYAALSLAVGIYIEGLPPDAHVPRGPGGGSPVGVGIGAGTGTFGSGVGLGLSFGGGGLGRGGRANKQLYDETQIWKVVQLAGK
jgi:hypothetical protein